MADIALSYVLTTYNKLPYLRQVLERLVAARQADEEIVVVDGGSTDATAALARAMSSLYCVQLEYPPQADVAKTAARRTPSSRIRATVSST